MPVDEPYMAEANRLYWETDDSVASIADRLDVSRRALYEAVRPISTGTMCEACGGELTFENRSARKQGMAVCPACDAERRGVTPAAADATAGAPIVDLRDPELRHRAVVLGSVAIAGVAVGTMAAIFAMRRDG